MNAGETDKRRSRESTRKADRRSGQAMAEMVVGLLSIMLLVAGLVQIGMLSRHHTATLLDARAEADAMAMRDNYMEHVPGPSYIQDWQEGVEGVRYTQKDEMQLGNPSEIKAGVLRHARPEQLARHVYPQRVQSLQESVLLVEAFEFVRGHSRAEPVPLLPVIRRLVAQDESIRMEHEVWMPWARGLGR